MGDEKYDMRKYDKRHMTFGCHSCEGRNSQDHQHQRVITKIHNTSFRIEDCVSLSASIVYFVTHYSILTTNYLLPYPSQPI